MKHRYLPRFDLPRRLRHCSPWSQAGTHAGHDHGFGGLLFMAKNMKDRFGGENFFGDMFFFESGRKRKPSRKWRR